MRELTLTQLVPASLHDPILQSVLERVVSFK